MPRPDVNARVRDIGNLAIDLVRVLDDNHVAVGQWNPHLEVQDLQIGLRHMLLTRIFDDAALALLEVCKPATTATNYNVQVEAVFD